MKMVFVHIINLINLVRNAKMNIYSHSCRIEV